jgi:hypothetical protein
MLRFGLHVAQPIAKKGNFPIRTSSVKEPRGPKERLCWKISAPFEVAHRLPNLEYAITALIESLDFRAHRSYRVRMR